MIYLFHGDDQVKSRQAIPRGRRHYDLAELTPEKLEQIMAGNELFTDNQDVYLWAGKKLSAAQIKTIPGAQIKEFAIPRVLWQFLSSRRLKDLETCLKTAPVELVSESHTPKEYTGLKLAVGFYDTMISKEIIEFKKMVKTGKFTKADKTGTL